VAAPLLSKKRQRRRQGCDALARRSSCEADHLIERWHDANAEKKNQLVTPSRRCNDDPALCTNVQKTHN